MIVVVLPRCQHGPGVIERGELGDVEAFVAKPAVERLAKAVLDGLPGPNEVELHATSPDSKPSRYSKAGGRRPVD